MGHSQRMFRTDSWSVVMLGASGAVGGQAVRALMAQSDLTRVTALGRRRTDGLGEAKLHQLIVDVFDPQTYRHVLPGHSSAICTLGVGQPSAVSREEFVKVDKDAVLAFAKACREAGVSHFALLSSVGADTRSRSFYLRTKGQLEEGLRALAFPCLSLFRPSMILTPSNRYGAMQGVLLALWPWLGPLLAGPLRIYRGVPVEVLGRAIALNTRASCMGVHILHWDEIVERSRASAAASP